MMDLRTSQYGSVAMGGGAALRFLGALSGGMLIHAVDGDDLW